MKPWVWNLVLLVSLLLFERAAFAQFGSVCNIGSWELPARSEWRCTYRKAVYYSNSTARYYYSSSPALEDEAAAEFMPRFRREVAPGSLSNNGTWTSYGDLAGHDSYAIHIWCNGYRSSRFAAGIDAGPAPSEDCESGAANEFPQVFGEVNQLSYRVNDGYYYEPDGEAYLDGSTWYQSIRVQPGVIEVYVLIALDEKEFPVADEESWLHVLTYTLGAGFSGDVGGLSEECCTAIVNKLEAIRLQLVDFKSGFLNWTESWDLQDAYLRDVLERIAAGTTDFGTFTGSSMTGGAAFTYELIHQADATFGEFVEEGKYRPLNIWSVISSDETEPPTWTFTLPSVVLSSLTIPDRDYTVDFSIIDPFMTVLRAFQVFFVSLAMLTKVWSELRRQ